MDLYEHVDEETETLTFSPVGKLDAATVGFFKEKYDAVKGLAKNVKLDLSDVGYLSGDGVQLIVQILKETKEKQGDFEIIRTSPAVSKVLSATGVQTAMEKAEKYLIQDRERGPDHAMLRLSGYMDVEAANELVDRVRALMSCGINHVMLDMSDVAARSPEFTKTLVKVRDALERGGKILTFL